jgi:hypothetical protein
MGSTMDGLAVRDFFSKKMGAARISSLNVYSRKKWRTPD